MGSGRPLPDALDSREAVEPAIEAQNAADTLRLHDGNVDGVPRRQASLSEHDRARTLDSREIHREDPVHEAQDRIEGRLDRVESIDGDVAVEDLLEYLGVGHEPLTLGDTALQKPLGIRLQGMRRSHEVHGNVGIDENHGRDSRV